MGRIPFKELLTDKQQNFPFFLLVICALGYLLYWFVSNSSGLRKWTNKHFDEKKAAGRYFAIGKLTGFILLGLVPALWFFFNWGNSTLHKMGLRTDESLNISLKWFFSLSIPIVCMNLVIARLPKMQSKHPQVRYKEWKLSQFLFYLFMWAIYLFAYEFMFRWVLLVPLMEICGIWPAVALNIVIYSFAHLAQGVEESIGAMILGFFLCLATIATGSIWVAYLVHLVMAISGSYFALRFNPEMRIVRN